MSSRKISIKNALNPSWFLSHNDEDMYDMEYHQIMTGIFKRDAYKEIQKKNHDIFIELLFNGLRINTLLSDMNYYDEYYHNIVDDKTINSIISNIREKNAYGKFLIDLSLDFETFINDALCEETKSLYNDIMNIDLYKSNKFIHRNNDVFILIENGKTIYLYKIEFSNDSLYGTHYYKLLEENNGLRQISRFERYVRDFNDINEISIDESNLIALDAGKCKLRANDIIKCIRCLLVTNKWFNPNGEFNNKMPYTLFCENKNNSDKFIYKF